MTSRNPIRRVAPATRGPCRPPGMTKAQALRQAKSAAMVNARAEPPPPPNPCPPRRSRANLARAAPKRLDFTKPGLTKAMLARLQHSQKLKEAEEQRRRQEESVARRPRRTAAPLGGDARLGREKSLPIQWQFQGGIQEAGIRGPPIRKMAQEDFLPLSRGQVRRGPGEPSGISGPGRVGGPSQTSRRHSIVDPLPRTMVAEAANRSIQAIQETLDEQDVIECLNVQNKLQDLQSARRDFVMTIANVSGNAVSFADEITPNASITPESPQKVIYKLPNLDDPSLQPDYYKHQANLLAARQFLERREAAQYQREAQRRIDEEFARAAAHVEDDLRFDIPLEQDIMEGDISFEEDEDGTFTPCQSRIKASMPPIPQRDDPWVNYRSADIDELERFFDTTNYPIIASTRHERRPYLNPDLLELNDPWYRECPQPEDIPDLIEFDLMEFS